MKSRVTRHHFEVEDASYNSLLASIRLYMPAKKKALSFLARQFTQGPTWFFGCHLNDFWTRARVADIVFRHVISYEF